MNPITIVGGGIAGLTAAISCAEQGATVQVLEAHQELGGRAGRSTAPTRPTSDRTRSWPGARSGRGSASGGCCRPTRGRRCQVTPISTEATAGRTERASGSCSLATSRTRAPLRARLHSST